LKELKILILIAISIARERNLQKIEFLGFRVRVPAHPLLRIALGVILVVGGLLGFLPILGFWMLPLGLIILSIDFAVVRRFRRVSTIKLGQWLKPRWPKLASRIGFGV
jgi:purine-cytosine permease-like protein